MQLSDERSRFLLQRRNSGLTSQQVAREAGLSLAEEYRAEIGCEVEADSAQRLLEALGRLTGKPWTLHDAAIVVKQGGNL